LCIGGQLDLKKEEVSMAVVSAKKLPFSGLKKLRSEYEIVSFPKSFPGDTIGKIVSSFRVPKLSQSIGRLARCFLPLNHQG
jgi:hypothetical protein